MSAQTYEWHVGMTCDGCKGAVTRILSKVDGITSFEANVSNKTVRVTGNVNPEDITAKLDKWAKASNKELRYIGPK